LKEIFDKIITDLRLETCRNTIIGDLEYKELRGEERKRTAIGIELITCPTILFLNEPTSDLDSFIAKIIVKILVIQARLGRTVILTIHQPSS